jgi:hypothetical protein
VACRWTDSERDFIRANAAVMKDEALAGRLSLLRGRPVSVNAVRKVRAKLGLRKRHGRGRCELCPPRPPGATISLRLQGG